MVDLIPDQSGEPLQKRGPWSYVYSTLGSAVKAVSWAPFSAGSVLCAIAANGHLWTLRNVGGVVTVTDKGAPATASVVETIAGSGETGKAEVQAIRVFAEGGTFTLTLAGATTGALAYNASAADVATALNGLGFSGFLTMDVTKTTSGGVSTYTVKFYGVTGPGSGTGPRPLIGADATNLTRTDGDAPTATVTETTLGVLRNLANERQVVTLSATGGTFVVGFGGQSSSALAYNASAATVQTALEAVSTIGTGNATVTGSAGGPWTVTFVGSLTHLSQSLLTIDTTGLTNTGTGPQVGTLRPVFFNNILFPGTYAFDGTNCPQDMFHTFPTGSAAVAAYKSRLVTTEGTTLYFSAALDHRTWDSFSYVKATHPVTGVAALTNMILIFSAGSCERLRGTAPPSATSSGDFTLEPAFGQGCSDPGSIVVYGDRVIWANEKGVFTSDGAAIKDLTESGGLKQYWSTLMASIYPSAGTATTPGTLAAGAYGKYYVISATPNGGSAMTMLCDLESGRWFFFSNMTVLMFAESQEATDQLFMAVPGSTSVGELSSCFTTAGRSNSGLTDANGTTIAPVLELPFYRMGSGSVRFRDIFLGVSIDNTSGGAGSLLFDYVTQPDSPASAYVNVTDDAGVPISQGATSGPAVCRVPLHVKGNGLGLRVRQSGGSRKTAFYELEAQFRVLEGRF